MIRSVSNSYRRLPACLALCAMLLAPSCFAAWNVDGKPDNPQWKVVVQPGDSTAYPVFEFDLWHYDPSLGIFALCTEVELKCSTNNFAELHYWADSFFRTDPNAVTNSFFDSTARFYFADYDSTEETRRMNYTTGTASTLTDVIGVEGFVNQLLVIPDASTFQWLEKGNDDLLWVYRLRTPIDMGITNSAGRGVWQPCVPVAWMDELPVGINID